jgi:hypothetical protein
MYSHFIISNFKINNYNLCESMEQREGKRIKKMRGGYKCEGKKKNEKRKEKISFISKNPS